MTGYEYDVLLTRARSACFSNVRRVGRTAGRPPKLADDDIEAAEPTLANPDIGAAQIAQRLGVSLTTLHRRIPAARAANASGV
jgi:DNA-directed RNA polymerase specialized sigma24 family protein